EGLALRIAAGEVPPALQGVELRGLDLGLLQAGASVKGEFERRLQGVIDEVKAAPKPLILFIDEAHTLIGAGGQAGSGDAANLLKPALARGELRTIAATTWSEYKKYFEKDPALARRFQPVQLHEPSVTEAVTILRGLAPVYEKSHGIYLRDDAVTAAAELSARYLAGRQLPDKAVDVLDTACARVRISLAAAPEALERLRGGVAEGERQREAMRRDLAAGLPVDAAVLQRLEQRLLTAGDEIEQLESRWTRQRQLAERLLELRKRTAEARSDANEDGEAPSLDELESELRAVQAELAVAQAEQRLVSHEVCPRLVAEVISHWTGVPLAQLAREHSTQVANFAADLRARVRGQEQAVEALDRAMRAAAAGLNKPDAPVGVFLLVGPSGVGKTETALALADLLYGGERFLTTLNMGEFQEKHSVARLIGAPPGYVGYDEGGQLTEAVRCRPYSVILFDEIEKAHPDVFNVLLQLLDDGRLTDSQGRTVDFKNSIVIMTSNLGSDLILEAKDMAAVRQAVNELLRGAFKPEFLNRIDETVIFERLQEGHMAGIIKIQLEHLSGRLAERKIQLVLKPDALARLAHLGYDPRYGARPLKRLIQSAIQNPLARAILKGEIRDGEQVTVQVKADEFSFQTARPDKTAKAEKS
ncbi:MAG TPA: type VI secretion system ATPase TssH, partial [Spirochaetaceae bacterium]|nr:type VI secretion system ATPase TssH [Spirochaetaceae bacterium]